MKMLFSNVCVFVFKIFDFINKVFGNVISIDILSVERFYYKITSTLIRINLLAIVFQKINPKLKLAACNIVNVTLKQNNVNLWQDHSFISGTAKHGCMLVAPFSTAEPLHTLRRLPDCNTITWLWH